jgi:hypothetical protein
MGITPPFMDMPEFAQIVQLQNTTNRTAWCDLTCFETNFSPLKSNIKMIYLIAIHRLNLHSSMNSNMQSYLHLCLLKCPKLFNWFRQSSLSYWPSCCFYQL